MIFNSLQKYIHNHYWFSLNLSLICDRVPGSFDQLLHWYWDQIIFNIIHLSCHSQRSFHNRLLIYYVLRQLSYIQRSLMLFDLSEWGINDSSRLLPNLLNHLFDIMDWQLILFLQFVLCFDFLMKFGLWWLYNRFKEIYDVSIYPNHFQIAGGNLRESLWYIWALDWSSNSFLFLAY